MSRGQELELGLRVSDSERPCRADCQCQWARAPALPVRLAESVRGSDALLELRMQRSQLSEREPWKANLKEDLQRGWGGGRGKELSGPSLGGGPSDCPMAIGLDSGVPLFTVARLRIGISLSEVLGVGCPGREAWDSDYPALRVAQRAWDSEIGLRVRAGSLARETSRAFCVRIMAQAISLSCAQCEP